MHWFRENASIKPKQHISWHELLSCASFLLDVVFSSHWFPADFHSRLDFKSLSVLMMQQKAKLASLVGLCASLTHFRLHLCKNKPLLSRNKQTNKKNLTHLLFVWCVCEIMQKISWCTFKKHTLVIANSVTKHTLVVTGETRNSHRHTTFSNLYIS